MSIPYNKETEAKEGLKQYVKQTNKQTLKNCMNVNQL